MFRKKDVDAPRPSGGQDQARDTGFPRPVQDAMASPDLPRRHVEPPQASAANAGLAKAAAEHPERKRLIVGDGISLSGEITACDRLIVEGSVQLTLNQTRAIEIAATGRFTNGRAEVEEAEISGVYEGEITVRKRLLIRSTGEVRGTVRYGELEIESGGRLSGNVSMIDEPQRSNGARREPEAGRAAGSSDARREGVSAA